MSDSISYRVEMLHLALPPGQIDELNSPENEGAIASFSVDTTAPKVTRSFFLLPLAHGFSAPSELDMCPLGALLHATAGMLVLYEVKGAAN